LLYRPIFIAIVRVKSVKLLLETDNYWSCGLLDSDSINSNSDYRVLTPFMDWHLYAVILMTITGGLLHSLWTYRVNLLKTFATTSNSIITKFIYKIL